MAFTVEDFQDLLQLLEQHPEWQAELRRRLLPDELLELPALMRQLTERVDALAEAQTRTEQRIDALSSQVSTLVSQVSALAEAQTRTEQRIDALSSQVSTLVSQVSALAEAQTRTEQRIDALAAAQERTEARLGQLVEAQERTEARLGELAEAQERTEAGLRQLAEAQERTEATLRELARRLDRHDDRLGSLDGRMLELQMARRFPAYFSRLARRLRLVDPSRLADSLDDSVEQGVLTADERESVLDADFVLTGRRRNDGAEVYLVAEVSVGIGVRDVQRASDRAALLARLGRPTIPVVAGERISQSAGELAQATGVQQVVRSPEPPEE